MNETSIERLQELDHLFRKLVRKFVKERDKITIEGISLPGLMIMRKVLLAGEQRLSDLAEELDLSSGAITAQCDKLEDSGYAERTRYKEDRRTIYLNITEQGREFLDRHSMIGQINIDVIFNGLSEAEINQQLRIFRKLIENVEGMSEKILTAVTRNEGIRLDSRSCNQAIINAVAYNGTSKAHNVTSVTHNGTSKAHNVTSVTHNGTPEAHNEPAVKQTDGRQLRQEHPKDLAKEVQSHAREAQSQAREAKRNHYLSY